MKPMPNLPIDGSTASTLSSIFNHVQKDFKRIIKKASSKSKIPPAGFPQFEWCYILNALFADNGVSKIDGKNLLEYLLLKSFSSPHTREMRISIISIY